MTGNTVVDQPRGLHKQPQSRQPQVHTWGDQRRGRLLAGQASAKASERAVSKGRMGPRGEWLFQGPRGHPQGPTFVAASHRPGRRAAWDRVVRLLPPANGTPRAGTHIHNLRSPGFLLTLPCLPVRRTLWMLPPLVGARSSSTPPGTVQWVPCLPEVMVLVRGVSSRRGIL